MFLLQVAGVNIDIKMYRMEIKLLKPVYLWLLTSDSFCWIMVAIWRWYSDCCYTELMCFSESFARPRQKNKQKERKKLQQIKETIFKISVLCKPTSPYSICRFILHISAKRISTCRFYIDYMYINCDTMLWISTCRFA